jgi:hypothetical protein
MQLALTTTKTYKFKVSAYKVGTGKGLKTLTDTDGTNYYLPTKTPLKNIFIKGDILKDIDLASSAVLNSQTKIYPEVDAFYATKSLTLDKGTTSIDFTLLRMGFGINFTVDAITSGTMEIYVGNDTLKLNSTKTSAFTVRQFSTALNSFGNIYSNATSFGDSIAVSAKWISGSGTTVTATGKYKFLRNFQKTINIQLNTLTNNVTFEPWKIPTNGLVAWYPFNGNTNDESGNGNNGTILGTLATALDRFGNLNSSYNFTGTGCVKLPSLNLPSFTLNAWVKNTGTDLAIICKHYSASYVNSSYLLFGDPNKNNLPTIYNTSPTSVVTTTNSNLSWSDNKWHMITGTLSASNLTMYFDGILQTQISGGTSKATTFNTFIGAAYSSSGVITYQNFGFIDDVGFWNRALTQNEVTTLFNAK